MGLAELVDANLVSFKCFLALLLYVTVFVKFWDDYFHSERAIRSKIIVKANRHAGELGTISEKDANHGFVKTLFC